MASPDADTNLYLKNII